MDYGMNYSDELSARWLAGEKEEEPLDYSVLSVGVMTLGLILFVEVLRHKLDHEAAHRPFFKVVLEATYSELATLGLVELFIFLLLRYYELKNKERKEVFAEVHFALFYTAIFNAFQSVLCGIFTRRVSSALWVQTEHLELDHYVEIREAFDRASEEYYNFRESQRGVAGIRSCLLALRKPGLRRRYRNLLVQVRFHELRVQFLENNNLPLTLKISDYLKRSEESVLMHMVHVSGTAWLMLTGGFNLIYFAEGLIANFTGDPDIVGKSMAGIFFGMLNIFIVICVILYFKMRSIFEKILKMKHIGERDSESGARIQRKFFWFNEPQLVIALIQFMQFGYAIALALVIMFWSDLGQIQAYWYLLATLGCYSVFVFVLSRVLPQFTLCTSLGHLVNTEHLNETLAMHRLHEEQRKQKRRMVQLTFEGDDLDESFVRVTTDKDNEMTALVVGGPTSEHTSSVSSTGAISSTQPSLLQPPESTPNMLRALQAQDELSMPTESSGDSAIRPDDSGEGQAVLAELVKMDTATLRSQLSTREKSRLMEREQRRSNRKKAVSDGVQAMRGLGNMSKSAMLASAPQGELEKQAVDDAEVAKRARADRMAARRANRKKSVSASSIIQSWQNIDEPKKAPLPNLTSITEDHEHLPRKKSSSASEVIRRWQEPSSASSATVEDVPKFTLKNTDSLATNNPTALHKQLKKQRLREERRANRKKAVSLSDVIQAWRDNTTLELPGNSEPKTADDLLLHTHHEDDEQHGGDASGNDAVLRASPHDLKDDGHEEVTVVNLSDAKLVDDKAIAPAKKSVGFSDDLGLPVSDDDDSMIRPPKSGDDDDDTMDTGKSVGDLSDVGVALTEFESLRSAYHWEESWYSKLLKRVHPNTIKRFLHDFFVSDTHAVISHVFGSIVVFFLIGMRLESFNTVTGNYDPSDNTWELRIEAAFWWQAAWYMLFVVMSVLVLWSVNLSECHAQNEKQAYTAAVLDLFLSGLCLALLFVAESQRCCDDESEFEDSGGRALEEKSKDVTDGYAATLSWVDDPIYDECCPSWGHRTYGGYGLIEPFTALIGLRVLRFHLSKFLVQRLDSKTSKEDSSTERGSEQHGDHNHHGNGHGHGHSSDNAAMVDLWQRAINQNPQIVEKYGQFSAELFQVMLGLEIAEEKDHSTKTIVSKKQSITPSGSVADTNDQIEEIEDAPHYKLGQQYSKLSAECQGVILAGKLGKPVKSMSNLLIELDPSEERLPALPEEVTANEGQNTPTKLTPVIKEIEFEVDNDQFAEEQDQYSAFIAPNARLTRSMRRCDRRLLPLLKDWTAVDLVMTDYEIVYFEVGADDDGALSPEVRAKKEAIRLALQATKGGKGLRLIDVAVGRKVVGHLDLSEITEVHVERDMPLMDVSFLQAKEGEIDISNEVPSEYYQKATHIEVHNESRRLRWAQVKEDRLKIVSIHGILYLRYYSDLNDADAHRQNSEAEDEAMGHLKKDIAFQWAQTLAHICGTEQLKQNLPHFGANNSEELRDYLEIIHHKSDETKGHRRGRSSMFSLPHSTSYRDFTARSRSPHHSGRDAAAAFQHRRASSFGDSETRQGPEKAKSMRFFRRSASSGDPSPHEVPATPRDIEGGDRDATWPGPDDNEIVMA